METAVGHRKKCFEKRMSSITRLFVHCKHVTDGDGIFALPPVATCGQPSGTQVRVTGTEGTSAHRTLCTNGTAHAARGTLPTLRTADDALWTLCTQILAHPMDSRTPSPSPFPLHVCRRLHGSDPNPVACRFLKKPEEKAAPKPKTPPPPKAATPPPAAEKPETRSRNTQVSALTCFISVSADCVSETTRGGGQCGACAEPTPHGATGPHTATQGHINAHKATRFHAQSSRDCVPSGQLHGNVSACGCGHTQSPIFSECSDEVPLTPVVVGAGESVVGEMAYMEPGEC